MQRTTRVLWLCLLLSAGACQGETSGVGASETAVDTAGTTTTGIVVPTTGATSTGTTTGTTTTSGGTTSSPTTTLPDPTGGGLACGGKVYACTDGMDNDGDGKVDLDDPECTGPCDDDEGSFQTGIPGDNVDCKQDCFFDGNSGQGEGCTWDLKCDPANPGADVGCPYTGGNNCAAMMEQSEQCKMNCEPYVPNGCDCFGCCTVSTPDGEVHIFLNSGPECSLLNLEACAPCTPQIEECGNACNPDDCEVCFGEDELPEGCDDPGGCEGWPTCLEQADCPPEFYCVTGCCIPPPEG
ncbi:MAG TPA: hypothetical protein VIK91_12070 [Nannocystis sp.]